MVLDEVPRSVILLRHVLVTASLLFSVTASSAGRISSDCAQGLTAFEQNLYTPILRPHCAECHDGTGSGPVSGPPHSTSDPVASYEFIKASGYVDFSQPVSSSVFVDMVAAAHWKDYDPSAVGTTVEAMTAALEAWWTKGEATCADHASAASQAIAIPPALPLAPAEQYVPMVWDLDSLGGVFVGSRFEVEIQLLSAPTSTTPGAYRLRKPRISTPQTGLTLAGIKFFLNGKSPLNAVGWEDLQAKIGGHLAGGALAPAPLDPFEQAPVLSGRPLILLQDLAQGDVLSVAFTGVTAIPAPKCGDLAGFRKTILPAVRQGSCVSCHQKGAPSEFNGGDRLLFSGSVEEICAAVLERTDSVHADASPFYLVGFLNENDHPPTIAPPDLFSTTWESWVQSEQSSESGGAGK